MPSIMIHIRLAEELKEQASEALASQGLTLSAAVRLFLTQVVAEQGLPFPVKPRSVRSRRALAESRAQMNAYRAAQGAEKEGDDDPA